MKIAFYILFAIVILSCTSKQENNKSNYDIPTPSMDKKLEVGDYTFVNKSVDSSHIDRILKVEKRIKKESLDFKCNTHKFSTVKEQADSLIYYIRQYRKSTPSEHRKWEYRFFCVFPNSFTEMEHLFGYDNQKGSAPLYTTKSPSRKYINKRIPSDVIGFFSELKSIPKHLYYSKYININIDGKWQADNIQEAFGFHYSLLHNPKSVCSVLVNYRDEEIKSVFRFIFDGPHPKNSRNEEIYNSLKPLLDKQNKRIAKLFAHSYNKIITKNDKHVH